ncbi:putative D-aminoacylase [Stipitochalara longipes BDJ]|nr:putative D-aminoacylase [Stipitochalara longipes BDJ]
MKTIIARLQLLSPVISEICQISGNVGLSIGVVHRGEVIHRANFGYRDVDAQLAPDSDTIYHLGFVTKATIAAAYANLVSEGKLHWDIPVKDYFPSFQSTSDVVRSQANIVHLLAHRMALASKNAYTSMGHQIHLVPKEQTTDTIGILEVAGKFHEDFKYNNWIYGMAGIILEKLAGETLGTLTKRNFFDPLGLKHTTFDVPRVENYAQSYCTLDDGTPFHVARPGASDDTSLAGAQGLKSSINDLLIYYKSFMDAANHQSKTKMSFTPNNPFVDTTTILSPHVDVSNSSQLQTYGLGWVITSIPGSLGAVGTNRKELGNSMPVVAPSANKTRVWYHNGSLPGAYSSLHILPESETVIVVLSNTLALTDVPYFVGQLLIEAILAEPKPTDFVSLTRETVRKHLRHYPEMRSKMTTERQNGTAVRPLDSYVGRYFNSISTLFIDISQHHNGLLMTFQGIPEVNLDLAHYENDVFARLDVHRDDDMKKALFPSWKIPKQKIVFLSDPTGAIDRFSWHHDSYLSYGEVFTKHELQVSVSSEHNP